MGEDVHYGDAWAYESIVGALPGIHVSERLAFAIQFGLFQAAVLVLAAYYDLWDAAVAGTVAVVLAAAGSVEMVRIAARLRSSEVPEPYRRLLFGSSLEVVLAVLAYVALVTHLFVFDPRQPGVSVLARLLGPRPPVLAVYVLLLVLWDVCYRVGTNWWTTVAALWRSYRYRFDRETATTLLRADAETMAFGLLQLVLVPFVRDPVLTAVLLAHVVAIVLGTGGSMLLLRHHTDERLTRT